MAKKRLRNNIYMRLGDLPGLFDSFGTEDAPGAMPEIQFPGARSSDPPASADEEPIRMDSRHAHRPDRLRFISFGSGSSGNCAYIGTPSCGLLIDAGVDNKKIAEYLSRNGIAPSSIAGILITHDHGDHVKFAYSLLRRNQHWRLYATNRVLGGLLRRHNISRRIQDYHSAVFKEIPFRVGDMEITAFETSHDATDNVGFSISLGETRFVVATDMGVITERADYYMRRATSLMIESNYDEHMLRTGHYPEYLKARILSPTGHHDNVETARYLARIYRPELRHIFLCHLSQDNNTPEIALAATMDALTGIGVRVLDPGAPLAAQSDPASVIMTALPRSEPSLMFAL